MTCMRLKETGLGGKSLMPLDLRLTIRYKAWETQARGGKSAKLTKWDSDDWFEWVWNTPYAEINLKLGCVLSASGSQKAVLAGYARSPRFFRKSSQLNNNGWECRFLRITAGRIQTRVFPVTVKDWGRENVNPELGTSLVLKICPF